ncbi:MAG: serine hydrolase [Gemmatimonadales bacterium]
MRAVATLAVLAVAAVSAQAQRAPLAGFDASVERALKTLEHPGVALAVVQGDSVVYAKGFGVRRLGDPTPVDAHTLFAIGSSSKAFTGLAVAMLVDEGKVEWDAPLARYLPELQLSEPYVSRELTVRDALTHRSGLARTDLVWISGQFDSAELLRRLRFVKPAGGFRAVYGYQNLMFLAAGTLVARVSGAPSWGDFVERRIFAPLGMRESNTTVRDLAGKTNVAQPHAQIDGTLRTIPFHNVDIVAPAGSINSNVLDMAKWVRFQLANGVVDDKPLLGERALAETRTPQFLLRRSGRGGADRDGYFSAYGFGWFLEDYHGRFVVHHGGNIDGMTALVAFMPDEQLGVVVLTNMNGSPLPGVLAYDVFDRFLGRPAKDRVAEIQAARERGRTRAEQAAAKAEAARVKGTSPSLALDRYAGEYADSANGTMKVALEGGKLVLRYGPEFTGDLEHWHFDTFRARWRSSALVDESTVVFRLDQNGRIASIDVDRFGEFGAVP